MILPVHSHTAQVHKVKRSRSAGGQSWGDASVRSISPSMVTSLRIPWIFSWFLLLFWIVELPNKEEHSEQRTVLKFLAKNGLSPSQSWSRLHKVFRQNALSLCPCACILNFEPLNFIRHIHCHVLFGRKLRIPGHTS